jgi:cytochrome c oxidase subunit II
MTHHLLRLVTVKTVAGITAFPYLGASSSGRCIQILNRPHPAMNVITRSGEFMQKKYMLLVTLACILFGMKFIGASAAAQATPQRVEVTAKRFEFEPAEITLKKGVPVDFVLKSADVAHGIRIRELNLDLKVTKGGTSEVTLTPDKTGDFVGHCSVFCGTGHGKMAFTVHVVQ